MNQEISHRRVRVAEVRAEDVFTEEVIKLPPHGMTAEKRAALMTRAVKLALPLLHILLKRAEERREKRVLVALRRGVDLTAVIGEIRGIVINHLGNLPDQIRGKGPCTVLHEDNRDLEGVSLDAGEQTAVRLGRRHDDDGRFRQVRGTDIDNGSFRLEGFARFRRSCDGKFFQFSLFNRWEHPGSFALRLCSQ